MKPESPLPSDPPFLSLYTPTYRRPQALAKCLFSVGEQTAVEDIEQIVVPDHVRYGVASGLFGRLPWYGPVLRGTYVNILADDDVLGSETVVAQVKAFALKHSNPPLIIVSVKKGAWELPACDPKGPPEVGAIDMTSYIVRRDVWLTHLHEYKVLYEGDYWFAKALYEAGVKASYCDVMWAIGGASNGRPEY